MNKLRFLHEVAKAAKERNVLEGTLSVVGKKNGSKLLTFDNEFRKDLLNHTNKMKVSSMVHYDGSEVKHESCTEMTLNPDHKNCFHHGHHKFHGHRKMHTSGLKGCFGKISFFFNLLNKLEVNKLDIGGYETSLKLDDFPEEMVNKHLAILESDKFKNHPHGELLKQIHAFKGKNADFKMYVDDNYNVERVQVLIEGTHKEEPMTGNVILTLNVLN